MTIGVIGAMDNEIRYIVDNLSHADKKSVYGYDFYTGMYKDFFGRYNDIVVVKCGVGKVNAARCTQILIDRFFVNWIINTGVAGSISPEVSIGDVFIPKSIVQHDFDVTCLGYSKGYMCTGEDSNRPTYYKPYKTLRNDLLAYIEDLNIQKGENIVVKEGVLATGDIFIHDKEMKNKIRSKFGASAVEMESGAVGQTSFAAGIPFVVLRVISDNADGSAPEDYQKFENEMAEKSAKIVMSFLYRE